LSDENTIRTEMRNDVDRVRRELYRAPTGALTRGELGLA
jgi:hypothetical protein